MSPHTAARALTIERPQTFLELALQFTDMHITRVAMSWWVISVRLLLKRMPLLGMACMIDNSLNQCSIVFATLCMKEKFSKNKVTPKQSCDSFLSTH